ncbi:uncharacterized protein [Bos mutus]|uniref:uncharacterized protein n=1 Tax=Bos mutus TaxID=72004 RepID=UPI0038B5D157
MSELRKENGLREDLKARWPSRAATAASERRRRGGARGGGTGRAGPGGRGGLGAARSAGPSSPLALRRAALGGADWALWRRGGEAEAGAVGAKEEEEEEKEEGLGPGRGGGLAVGLRPRLSGGGRELCGGRGSSKWRHVDPRRNRAVVVPEDISHPVPAHWLRGATFTHTPAPASAPSRRRHSKGQPRRPARTRAGPAARAAVTRGARGAGLGTAGSVDLVSRKH